MRRGPRAAGQARLCCCEDGCCSVCALRGVGWELWPSGKGKGPRRGSWTEGLRAGVLLPGSASLSPT